MGDGFGLQLIDGTTLRMALADDAPFDLVWTDPPYAIEAPLRTRAQIQRDHWLALDHAEALRLYLETDVEIVDGPAAPRPDPYAALGRHVLGAAS